MDLTNLIAPGQEHLPMSVRRLGGQLTRIAKTNLVADSRASWLP
jgi:hypothetical protein